MLSWDQQEKIKVEDMTKEQKILKLRRRTWDALCKNPDFANTVILLAINSNIIRIDDMGGKEATKDLLK